WQGIDIRVCQEVDSTNRLARQAALDGAAHGSVFAAERQSAGRGRFGRSFYSPEGRGIYLSVLLCPPQGIPPTLLTTAAAVAVCRAVRSLTGLKPRIKWVNDLVLDQKKICGILTEAVTDWESGAIESVVIGIGLNVYPPEDLPPELAQGVGSLYGESDGTPPVGRSRLAAGLLNELFRVLETIDSRAFLADYRAWS
ncbi:MAG: biotin--[acetyl-CoA-carboxylase] ligase, partial [Oscillospiraceae bacterium]